MSFISLFIGGTPLSRGKPGTPKPALQLWKDQVAEQTRDLPPVQDACVLRVTFVLADEAFRTAHPYGPDLDNLLKPFLDALKETVLQPNEDACIVSIQATKALVGPGLEPGAHLEILPVSILG